MDLMVSCSSIFKLRVIGNQFKARENKNRLVYRSNCLNAMEKSLPVVPIDIAEN